MAGQTSLADNRAFWRLCQAILIVVHAAGLYAWLRYATDAPATVLWLIILAIHVLELPMAFIALRGRSAQALTVIVATLIFGFTWWVPARRGLYD